MADLYSLLVGDDASAQEQAQALAAALAPQRQLGMVAQLSGSKRLAPIGQTLLGQADQREAAIQQAMTGRLTRAMEMERQKRGLDAEAARQQAGFTFEGGQNALNRALKREEFGAAQETARKKAEADAKEAQAKATSDLRKELHGLPQYKRTQEVAESFDKIRGAAETGAGDMSLLYGYLKMLDPGSTVREGEFATGKSVEGLPGIIEAYRNTLMAQGILPAGARSQIKAEAARLMQSQLGSFKATRDAYQGLAGKAGIDVADVLAGMPAEQAGPPAAGGSGGVTFGDAEEQELQQLMRKYPTTK